MQASQSYTILIASHARAEYRRLRLTRQALWLGVGVATLLVLCASLVPFFFARSLQQATLGARLSRENAALRRANGRFDAALTDIKERFIDFENKSKKFALVFGVEGFRGAWQGAGGSSQGAPSAEAPSLSLLRQRLLRLHKRAQTLAAAYSVLEQVYEDRSTLLGSMPSILPVKGILGHGYGWRRDRFTGQHEFHVGIDISAPSGREVVAPADGLVIEASHKSGYGSIVALSHGNDITTRYAHLGKIVVKRGQRVRRGEAIGWVGSRGPGTGPHLHYEVRVRQQPLDPMHFILEDLPIL
ncbi:MAG: M23 family metallopeptidase [Acidobacteriota bacterium]